MAAHVAWSKGIALAAAGALVAVGLQASSAQSRFSEPTAEVQLMTAGPGTITISPAENGDSATCEVDAQEYQVPDEDCIHHFDEGTIVTLTAEPKPGHSFVGWSDFKCARRSTSCTMTLAPGPRYVAARFSPVTLKILDSEKFGSITVTPKPSRACAFDYDKPCEYAFGTTVTLRRSRSAPGFFWIGSCIGNRAGKLDAPACTIRLQSSEVVGAGYTSTGDIPPVKGSGIEIRLAGKGQGKVTGGLVNGGKTLRCQGGRCLITELTRYDYVRLKARALGDSRWDRWSDGVHDKKRVVGLAATHRLWAKFDRG
jgi:Divergent InlB B-repeat domain